MRSYPLGICRGETNKAILFNDSPEASERLVAEIEFAVEGGPCWYGVASIAESWQNIQGAKEIGPGSSRVWMTLPAAHKVMVRTEAGSVLAWSVLRAKRARA